MVGINKAVYENIKKAVSNNYMPKWAVFVIDIILVTASFFIATFIWQSITLDFNTNPTFQYIPTIYISIFTIYILIFRTFSGIIRYSSTGDLLRLMSMVVISGITFHIIEIKTGLVDNNFRTSKGLIAFWFISSFLALFIFRKVVRFTYHFWQSKKYFNKRSILLINNNFNFDLANLLSNYSNNGYIPVVLLDKSGKLKGKRINNLPIVTYNADIEIISKKYRAETLLIFRDDVPSLNGLSEDCLANNIEMIVSEVNTFSGKIDFSKNVHKIQIEDLLNRNTIVSDTNPLKVLFYNRIVLVTGGAGSIGSEIVRQLCKFNCHIIILDSAESPLHNITLEVSAKHPDKEIIPIICDVRNRTKLEKIFKEYKPEIVFHAAAYKHVPLMENFPEEAILANVLGSKNIAELCIKYSVFKMVMVSTDKAVNPTNVMGASKRIAEQYINALYLKHSKEGSNVKMVTTRFGNVLGSNGSVVPLFKEQITKGGPVTITHKDIIRYFMTIPEACSLVLEAASMCNGGEIFVFDMGKPVKIYDLAIKMIKLAGLKPHIDISIVETGLRPGEKLYEELLTNKEQNLPTYNEKIMIAKVDVMPYVMIEPLITNLIEESRNGNKMEVVKLMKKIVPEYISNNSIYESLDVNKNQIVVS